MAREWEKSEQMTTLDFLDNPFVERVNPLYRRAYLDQRRFYPEKLEGFDSRSGSKRRYMRGGNTWVWLRPELKLRNRDGLQGWSSRNMM